MRVTVTNDKLLVNIINALSEIRMGLTKVAQLATIGLIQEVQEQIPDFMKEKVKADVAATGEASYSVLFGSRGEYSTAVKNQKIFLEKEAKFVTINTRGSMDPRIETEIQEVLPDAIRKTGEEMVYITQELIAGSFERYHLRMVQTPSGSSGLYRGVSVLNV